MIDAATGLAPALDADGLRVLLAGLAIGLGAGVLIGGVVAGLVVSLRARGERARIEQALIRAEAEREHLSARYADLEAAFDRASDQLDAHFRRLAQDALRTSQDSFLTLAQRALERSLAAGEQRVAAREHAVEALVRPIRDLLGRTESELRSLEQTRAQAFATLEERLARLSDDHQRLTRETHALTRALSKPGVRGRWGELTLKRAVELAGMSAHCDFTEQAALSDADGRALRPDLLVRLPGGRVIVVDAKSPLDAYLDAVQTDDPAHADAALDRHAEQLRARIVELGRKRYFAALAETPEFTVLFVPGERMLSVALERRPELFDLALERRIHLATPGTLIALLRAVEAGWQQAQLTEHAYQIRDIARELTERIAQFGGDLAQLGQHLGRSVEQFNRLTTRFDRELTRDARRLEGLGIRARGDHASPTSLHAPPPSAPPATERE